MATALLLALATIATLTTMSNGQSVANVTVCPPCTKILEKVCATDKEGEVRTFSNHCMMDYCNCLLNTTNSNRVFTLTYEGNCKVKETEVPECFLEGITSVSPGAGNKTNTEATTGSSGTTPAGSSAATSAGSSEATSAGSSGATSAPTPGGRSNTNTTTKAPGGGAPGLKAMLLTVVLPLAALSVFM